MKKTIKVEKEVNIKYLHAVAGVRYWEDATVSGIEDAEGNLIPCRKGDNWEPIIDIDAGKIINWKQGVTAYIHYKVCDDGTYNLEDKDRNVILSKEGYVPNIMCPEDDGFGDYIIMKVLEDGTICNWNPNIDDFLEDED